MHVQTLISLLLIFSLWASCNGIEDVASINITIADENGAPTINTLQITLWFDFTIYQCTLVDPIQAHTYSITTFDILGTSDCDKAPNAASESKMMIENNVRDGVIIDAVSIETTSGAWYGISGRCFDNALETVQKWLVEPNYSQYVMDELSCASGTSNTFLCLDNEKDDCGPARQIFYFDTTRANQFINDAAWSDGTDVTPQIVSCDPTDSPTDNPSYSTTNPTNFPSISPTYLPSFNPTLNPSDPTLNPSSIPSKAPSATPPSLQAVKRPTITIAPSKGLASTRQMIYSSTRSKQFLESPIEETNDILLALLLIVIAGVCITILCVLVMFVRHRKQISISDAQHMQHGGKVEDGNETNGVTAVDENEAHDGVTMVQIAKAHHGMKVLEGDIDEEFQDEGHIIAGVNAMNTLGESDENIVAGVNTLGGNSKMEDVYEDVCEDEGVGSALQKDEFIVKADDEEMEDAMCGITAGATNK